MPIIEALYSYGKKVYDNEMNLNTATDEITKAFPGLIADSSASFYIGLYSDYMAGKGSTWNQNSDLLVYYVEHISIEMGSEIRTKAYQGAMKFAKAKSKTKL